MELFLLVGVDQEGDASWDIFKDQPTAIKAAEEMNEVCFDKLKLYKISGEDLYVSRIEY